MTSIKEFIFGLICGLIFIVPNSYSQEIDVNTAIEKLEELAKDDDVKANWTLYSIYFIGKPQYRNVEKGIEILTRLSNLKVADAKEVLGDLYYYGKVVPQDYAKAAEWYADYVKYERDPDILTRYGILFALGRGVEQDKTQAFKLFKEASERGYIPAFLLARTTYQTLGPIERYFLK